MRFLSWTATSGAVLVHNIFKCCDTYPGYNLIKIAVCDSLPALLLAVVARRGDKCDNAVLLALSEQLAPPSSQVIFI